MFNWLKNKRKELYSTQAEIDQVISELDTAAVGMLRAKTRKEYYEYDDKRQAVIEMSKSLKLNDDQKRRIKIAILLSNVHAGPDVFLEELNMWHDYLNSGDQS